MAGAGWRVTPRGDSSDKPNFFFAPQRDILQIKTSGGDLSCHLTPRLHILLSQGLNLYSRLSILCQTGRLSSKCDQYLGSLSKIFCKNTPGDESVNQNPNKALSGSDPYQE